jgi:NADH dehydrogenase (ubiquinone) 1 alpha subcomplex subunit 9
VFGATGFTGRYVVNRLGKVTFVLRVVTIHSARSGAQIIIPFRGEEKSWDHLKVTGEVGQIIPLRYDIRDKGLIEKAISHSQIVINLLGARYETRNFSFEDVHIEATRHIAEVMDVLLTGDLFQIRLPASMVFSV